MAFCAKCGSEMADGAPFCGACGTPAAQPPAQPPVPGPVYQQPAAGSGGNGAKIALFSLLGLLVVGAVLVLLLGFAVGPKWFVKDDSTTTTTDSGGGGTTNTDKDTVAIEKVANTFLEAISKADGTLLASVLPPSEIKKTLGLDPDAKIDDATYKLFCDSLTTGLTQAMESDGTKSVKFTNVKYSVNVSGDTATAKVVGGEMTTVDVNGNKTTENAEVGHASAFKLIKEGGKWYVSLESM